MSSARDVIQQNLDHLHADPDYQSGSGSLDRKALQGHVERFHQHYVSYLNYYVHLQAMKQAKARSGELRPEIEAQLADRAAQGAEAFRGAISAMQAAQAVVDQSGLTKALDRHATSLCQFLDQNPQNQRVVDYFDRAGVPRPATDCAYRELARTNYDLLRVRGADGTLGGVVRLAGSYAPKIAASAQMIADHGLPLAQGAGGDSSAEAGGAIAGAVWIGFLLVIILVSL